MATVFGTGPGEKVVLLSTASRPIPQHRIEHHTFFLEDPSGNLLEFKKYYTNESAIFGERECREVGDSG